MQRLSADGKFGASKEWVNSKVYFSQSGNKVRSLEAQLDLAERKLKEYQGQLEKTGSVFLGDNSEFFNMMNKRENASDASFMGKYFYIM